MYVYMMVMVDDTTRWLDGDLDIHPAFWYPNNGFAGGSVWQYTCFPEDNPSPLRYPTILSFCCASRRLKAENVKDRCLWNFETLSHRRQLSMHQMKQVLRDTRSCNANLLLLIAPLSCRTIVFYWFRCAFLFHVANEPVGRQVAKPGIRRRNGM